MSILALTSDTLVGTPGAGQIEYNGQFFGTDSNASRAQLQRFVQGTAVASTSGTSIDFTGIPSWVKRITVMLSGVSTNGTSLVQFQLGAGSVTTTGYIGSGGLYPTQTGANSTTGMLVEGLGSASSNRVGSMAIHNITGNTWVGSGVFGSNHAAIVTQGASSIALSGTLDRVRITTVNGTDVFDAGTINIIYEG